MKALAAGILLIICVLFVSCSGGNRTTTPIPPDPAPSIAITVNVLNLPSGASANVTLTDPNGQAVKISSTQTLSAITGTYSVAAAPVVYGNSTYHATETAQQVTVAGTSATVTVDYYNVIPNTTKVLDQVGMQSLSLSSDGVLTISNSSVVAASLQPGDVLVSAPVSGVAPNGLLRKIVSVTSSGTTITANTTAATLADEITRARMSTTFTVSPSSYARKYAQRRALATAVTATSLSNPCAGNASTLSIPIDASLPPDALGHTLNASGELDVCSFKVTFNFDAKAPSATLSISAQQFSNILVQGQYSGSFDQRINLDPVELEDRVICLGNETCEAVSGLPQSIGNALAVIKPNATFFVGMSGTGAGGIYTGGTEAGQLEAGLKVQFDSVTPIASSTLQATSYPTALDLNADVKGYFGAAFGIQVFGSVTGHVDPDAFIELTANTNNNPWWTLKSGLEASAGLRTSVLGFFAHDYDTSRFELWSTGVASASGPYSGLPTVLGITPNSVPVNSTSLTLALSGSNFVPGAIVTFNGAPLSTTYKDPTSLTAVLSSYYLNTPGTFPVLVSNPNGSGSSSSSLPFSVIDTGLGNVTVSPASVSLVKGGTQTFTATVSGGGSVVWSVQEGAAGGSVVGGLYTAPNTTGIFHVVATNSLDSSKAAVATVIVIEPAQSGIITTVAGVGQPGYSGDNGFATSAKLQGPVGVAVDDAGNLYIADFQNSRVRKVDSSTGIITTVAGNGNVGYSGDGGPATSATLYSPSGVALDKLGNLYIADKWNCRIRKVDIATGVITTVAGSGSCGYAGDGGSAISAKLYNVDGVAVDQLGNIYIADDYNLRVRKVDALTGVITTVAGKGDWAGYSGDGGPATDARLNFRSIALDAAGNLYIADGQNNRVRRVDASTGIITTVAGNGTQGYSGDGGLALDATLNKPAYVSLDQHGNLYITDSANFVIRRVDAATGIITTIAGNGTQGYSGDGGPAKDAQLVGPYGITVDAVGNLYITESNGLSAYDSRVRKVTGPAQVH